MKFFTFDEFINEKKNEDGATEPPSKSDLKYMEKIRVLAVDVAALSAKINKRQETLAKTLEPFTLERDAKLKEILEYFEKIKTASVVANGIVVKAKRNSVKTGTPWKTIAERMSIVNDEMKNLAAELEKELTKKHAQPDEVEVTDIKRGITTKFKGPDKDVSGKVSEAIFTDFMDKIQGVIDWFSRKIKVLSRKADKILNGLNEISEMLGSDEEETVQESLHSKTARKRR